MLFSTVLAAAVTKRDYTILTSYTPGCLCTASDIHFKEYAYSAKIAKCERSVSSGEKARVAKPYGVAKSEYPNYIFDHLIPLSIGGSNDDDNIWPMPIAQENGGKDVVEKKAFEQLSNGQITQRQAITMVLNYVNNLYGTSYTADRVMSRRCAGQNH
ncbi:hypothetical protein EDD86DRAFT_264025 [Gorgonomyces haynaldii]|nr:hypothetical protein EDD86DRAFT_264025 [Gorgonomyces haynaldii]